MTLALLLWFVVAPTLPGADPDAQLVAARLRPRVVRMLAAPVAVAAACWLLGCAFGVAVVIVAALANAPTLAVLAPLSAFVGAGAGGAVLLTLVLRERVWLEALGLPLDWRGPWLAGELAEHLGWDRRSIPVAIPATVSRPRAPSPVAPPDDAWTLDTPRERWAPTPDEPTQWFDQAASLVQVLADTKRLDEAQKQRQVVPRIPGVRYLDAARIRTPQVAEG